MQEEGREKRKEDEELDQRKRKRDQEKKWEETRDERIGSWRDFQKGAKKDSGKEGKKKKMKVLG
jgi:DnaJ homolog subfamily C member 8